MQELRINPENVSHIKIYDLEATGYKWCDAIPLKRVLFNSITVQDPYEEGYWYNGHQGFFSDKIEPKSHMRTIEGELYLDPCISIFAGETKIKTKFFKTIEEYKEYCDVNFKNVNVII